MKNGFLILISLVLNLQLYGQDGKLFIILDNDTVSPEKSGIEVLIVEKKDTIIFHKGNKLIYPEIERDEDIKSIIIKIEGKNYEFFNKEKSNLPPQLLLVMGPFYTELFLDKRNMYVTLLSKPDMFDDAEYIELDEAQVEKQKRMRQLTVYYQIKSYKLIE